MRMSEGEMAPHDNWDVALEEGPRGSLPRGVQVIPRWAGSPLTTSSWTFL